MGLYWSDIFAGLSHYLWGSCEVEGAYLDKLQGLSRRLVQTDSYQ